MTEYGVSVILLVEKGGKGSVYLLFPQKQVISLTAEEHRKLHEEGIAHSHEHEHTHDHGHGHTHSHEHTKMVLNRLSRAIGHLQSVRQMVEDGRDCSEVLVQLAAVKSALNNTGKIILKDHIEHCLVDAVENGDRQVILDLEQAIDQFIK